MSTLEGFGGAATLEPSDVERLSTQLDAVRVIMLDGQKRTLAQLAADVSASTGKNATEASVSARLRDLRKEKFGGYFVKRESAGDGLFTYQVLSANREPIVPPVKNPITFNVVGTQTGRIPAGEQPVAGGRAASSFIDSLKAGE